MNSARSSLYLEKLMALPTFSQKVKKCAFTYITQSLNDYTGALNLKSDSWNLQLASSWKPQWEPPAPPIKII